MEARCDQRKELLCQFRKVIDLLCEDCPSVASPAPRPLQPPVEEPSCKLKPICVPPPPLRPGEPPKSSPCTCPAAEPVDTPKDENSCKPPNIMVCYKINKKQNSEEEKEKAKAKNKNLHQSKSRELRCGVLYIGCHCEKLNGLQDDCPRSECRGAPECLTRPPTCGPSEFSNGKHLYKKGCKKNGGANGNKKDEEELQEYECYPAVIDLGAACP